MRCILALILILLSASAWAQGSSVQQTGKVTKGHPVMWSAPNVVQDGGPATNGALTNLGITSNGGLPFCINSHPITEPYAQLCMSTSDRFSQLSIQGYNEATPPFNILSPSGLELNGTPLVPVVFQGSVTAGDCTEIVSVTATLITLKDAGAPCGSGGASKWVTQSGSQWQTQSGSNWQLE